MSNFKTMFYDIETGLLASEHFGLGEQVLRHGAILKGCLYTPILTIAYAINNGPVEVLITPPHYKDTKKTIQVFDKLVSECDVVIGKNNLRFDDKHINVHRLFNQLPGIPQWAQKSDDLERQMRRHFKLPSQALDAISNILGMGGKDKMEFSDWQHIKHYREILIAEKKYGKKGSSAIADVMYDDTSDNIIKLGFKAEQKMAKYNKKDVQDTRDIWNYCKAHFEPKYNRSMSNLMCKGCGSEELNRIHKTVSKGGTVYQQFHCKAHGGYAGKAAISKNGKLGRIT